MATAQEQIHVVSESEESQVCRISRNRIRRFPDQPRKHFDPEKLENLTQSIREKGQQIPVTVRPVSDDPEYDFEFV
ncbi:MAG: ParB N-terminal domain-containing protein, partial [Patescibacteria group bacterium]